MTDEKGQRSGFQFDVFKLNLLAIGALGAFAFNQWDKWKEGLLLCPLVSFCLFCFWVHQGLTIRSMSEPKSAPSKLLMKEVLREGICAVSILSNFVLFPTGALYFYIQDGAMQPAIILNYVRWEWVVSIDKVLLIFSSLFFIYWFFYQYVLTHASIPKETDEKRDLPMTISKWDTSMIKSKITTREDIEKLHNEIGQLRNQQFVLSTVALTAVGFSSWMVPTLSEGIKDGWMMAAVTSILQILLIVLFFWSIALRRMIGTISAYLKVKNASDWEDDFNKFSNKREHGYWSQTGWVRLVYIGLGLLLMGNFFIVSKVYLNTVLDRPAWLVGPVTAIYVLTIWILANIPKNYDTKVEEHWRSFFTDQSNDGTKKTESIHTKPE